MQRITVSLEDAVAQDLRVTAARQRTSVSQFVAGVVAATLANGAVLDEGEPRAGYSDGDTAPAPASAHVARPPASGRGSPSPSSSACPMNVPVGVQCKVCGKVHVPRGKR